MPALRLRPIPLLPTVACLGMAAALSACGTSEGTGSGHGRSGSGAAAGAARLEERYDARNDSTLIRVVPPPQSSGVHLVAGVVVDGRQPKQLPERLLVGLSWTGKEARFAGCERVRWRADGNTVAEVEVTRDVQIGGGGITEFLSGTVSFPRGQAMAAATHLSVNVCGTELDVPDPELELLRELARRATPQTR